MTLDALVNMLLDVRDLLGEVAGSAEVLIAERESGTGLSDVSREVQFGDVLAVTIGDVDLWVVAG